MNFIRTLFNLPKHKKENYTLDTYTSAGTVFTDGKLILSGYHPHKHVISGIGGLKMDGETYIDTAIRETVEELFEFVNIPDELLEDIKYTLKPRKTIQNQEYVMLVYTFSDLETILGLLSRYELTSRAYSSIPKTLIELLFCRIDLDTLEISHLCLLPLVKQTKEGGRIHKDFIQDMNMLI